MERGGGGGTENDWDYLIKTTLLRMVEVKDRESRICKDVEEMGGIQTALCSSHVPHHSRVNQWLPWELRSLCTSDENFDTPSGEMCRCTLLT